MCLCEIAEHLLTRAAAELQIALERRRFSIWARPGPRSDFETVEPDRWRLYKVRPITLTTYEKSTEEGGVSDLWARPDPVDADGPDGSVLYSIHVAMPTEHPTSAPVLSTAEISRPTEELVKSPRGSNGDGRYRYAESKYDPVIERAVREERRLHGKRATQAGIKRRAAAELENLGLEVPKKTAFDKRVKKIIRRI